MRLNFITIKNFKGIKDLNLDFDCQSASIYGDNATGKTSVYDAFLWLLFGKDSRGSATFTIKPVIDGEPVHNVETDVEALIQLGLDQDSITLRRVYREVWQRRRGDVSPTFTGHETLFFVDNLPVSQSKYKQTVEEIMPETTFRAMTNPFYFPETLKWQDRRTQLFQMFGDLTDDDVADTDPRFASLLHSAGRMSVEDYSKSLKVQIRNYNQTLKEIPARIDEVSRQIIDEDDEAVAEAAVDAIAQQLQELKVAMDATDDAELVAQRAAVDGEIYALQQRNNAHRDRTRIENAEKNRKAMNDVSEQLQRLGLAELHADLRVQEKTVANYESLLSGLREDFARVAYEAYEGQEACPTCGRPFTKKDQDTAQKAWEAHRNERLDAINAQGTEYKARLEEANKALSAISENLEKNRKLAAEYEQALAELRSAELAEDMTGFSESMSALTAKRESLMNAISAARAGVQERNAAIAKTMAEMQVEYINAKNTLSLCKASKAARIRVEELRVQQQETVEALETAEEAVALCEEFILARISMVEDRVNSHFSLVRWQLYREQINGGIEEICEATVDGIPYHDLNGAMRINAGLDIINACARVTGISAPVFVDNAESVTRLYDPDDTQVIRLVVSEGDSQLRLQK